MSQTGTYYAGTYGFPLTFKLLVSLADATSIELKIVQPNGTTITRTLVPGDVVTDEQLGTMQYTLQDGDIPDAGSYTLRLRITETGGRLLTARTQMTVL